jgi:ATP-binding cassette subfamily B protein
VTAIVGASGSGKTTLLKMILGFYQPTCGEILLNQKNLKEYNNSAWRANCGTVMQESFIFSDTIINNIGISDNLPNINRVREAIGIVNLEDFISNLPLGLNTKIGMDGHGLSTGQKQRILIARAIYKGADYIILDEATNSLDANNEFSIMNKLRKVFNGKTVIIVAHRLSTIRNADNIIVLDHGKIVENGTHGNLVLQKGYYLRLLKNQLK